PGDENRSEPGDARVAGAPDLERLERVHRTAGTVVGKRLPVAERGALALAQRLRVAGGTGGGEERAGGRLTRGEAALEVVQQDRRPAGLDGKAVAPGAERDAEPEVGRGERVRTRA